MLGQRTIQGMKVVLAALALAVLSPLAQADLGPGSAAPALSIKAWYKGAPVKEIGKEGVYIVEFWSTSCGPCIVSTPHLTEIAHKNPDVTVLGVSVWEDDKDGSIRKFVERMGDKMDYHVGYSGNQGGMAKTWMKAAGQTGVPTAFIVKGGVIQWIGHPMEMEEPLSQVKAGTFDLAKFRGEFQEEAAETRRQTLINDQIAATRAKYDSGHHREAHAALRALVANYPQTKATAEDIEFQWLAQEDPKAWEVKAVAMAHSKDSAALDMLRGFALTQATAHRLPVQVRRAMELALASTYKPNSLNLQYVVMVYEKLKEFKRAAGYAGRLLAIMPNDEALAPMRKAMEAKKAELEAKARQ